MRLNPPVEHGLHFDHKALTKLLVNWFLEARIHGVSITPIERINDQDAFNI